MGSEMCIRDSYYLEEYQKALEARGYQVSSILDFGSPKKSIAKVVNENDFDILVLGAHGHNWFKDLLLGTTVDAVRHKITIPLLVVKDH